MRNTTAFGKVYKLISVHALEKRAQGDLGIRRSDICRFALVGMPADTEVPI